MMNKSGILLAVIILSGLILPLAYSQLVIKLNGNSTENYTTTSTTTVLQTTTTSTTTSSSTTLFISNFKPITIITIITTTIPQNILPLPSAPIDNMPKSILPKPYVNPAAPQLPTIGTVPIATIPIVKTHFNISVTLPSQATALPIMSIPHAPIAPVINIPMPPQRPAPIYAELPTRTSISIKPIIGGSQKLPTSTFTISLVSSAQVVQQGSAYTNTAESMENGDMIIQTIKPSMLIDNIQYFTDTFTFYNFTSDDTSIFTVAYTPIGWNETIMHVFTENQTTTLDQINSTDINEQPVLP